MTTDQAVARFEAKARQLRAEGLHEAAHSWQRYASEMRHLAGLAESLPRARAEGRLGQSSTRRGLE